MTDLVYISKNRLKQLNRLKEKKYRDSESRFIVEGLKNVRELLASEFHVVEILITEKCLSLGQDILVEAASKICLISEGNLKLLADTVSPQGIIAIAEKRDNANYFNPQKFSKLLYLDHISDPGNLAAVFRNAAWFGFDGILLSPESVEVYSPKVVRGSAGAVFHIPFLEDFEIETNFEDFSSFTWIGADAGSKLDLNRMQVPDKFVLCLGNESTGLSDSLLGLLDKTVRIPSENTRIESLNLAIASAVIMYEITRKSIDHE